MKWIILMMVFLVSGSSVYAQGQLELGLPLKTLNGLKMSIGRLTESRCWMSYHSNALCIKRGFIFAHGEIEGGESVDFLGTNLFAQFSAGPWWSRVGFGFGLFNKRTKEVRVKWDFNLSAQYGVWLSDSVGVAAGWDHLSNGRSFAQRVGLKKFWPKHNDGGNTLIATILWRF